MRQAAPRLSGTNPAHSKRFNRRIVLQAVRMHGPLSRAEIARLTNLSPQTVYNIARELCASNLLRHDGRRKAGRGQPPVNLSINPSGGYTVGLQLEHHRLDAVLVNLAGEVLHAREVDVASARPANAFPLMRESVRALVAAVDAPPEQVLGVGLVMPGPLDPDCLIPMGPTNLPDWEGVDVAAQLRKYAGLPVFIETDATAAAVGEHLYGCTREIATFCYLFVGAGIGLGLIANGEPYAGAWGNRGEICHLTVVPGGTPCFCGNRGCLERYVSLDSVYEALRVAGCAATTVDDLTACFESREPALMAWLDTAAGPLRTAIHALETILDPGTIVLGGTMPDWLGDALLARIEPLLPSISVRRSRKAARVTRATAGRSAAALGAAMLPLYDALIPSTRFLSKPARAA